MRVFQHLVGADLDADELLTPALQLARKRVVVKHVLIMRNSLAQKRPMLVAENQKSPPLIFIWEKHDAKKKVPL